MSEGKILICDDREGRREDWKHDLKALDTLTGWSIEMLVEDSGQEPDFNVELDLLHKRQLAARDDASPPQTNESSALDSVDILIIDYDLALFEKTPGLTGENVAYLARCYSACKVIVGVNLTGHTNPFDLTLIDHLDSFADVNIGSEQLATPSLWGEERSGLSPWSWPSLPSLLSSHEKRIAAVGDGQAKVLETLGLTDIDLPRQVSQLVEAGENNDPTFDRFVRKSDLGLRGDDKPAEGTIVRVGAERAMKWLHTMVLPAQDFLIDAPHLAQRNPLLLASDELDDPETWDRTTSREDPDGGLVETLDSHKVGPSPWSDRPLWRWADLNGDDELPGVASPWERPETDQVFCEDISRFLPLPLARSFVVDDIPTSLATRYVSNPSQAEVTRIAGKDLSQVKYLPKLRFTL